MSNSLVLVMVRITGSANPSIVLFSFVVSVVEVRTPYSEVLVVVVTAICFPGRLYGEVSVAHIFGNHMVLQQQKPVVV